MTATSKPPILLVHGMFMTGHCWDGWVERLSARGHECHAPSWPGREGSASSLRATPDPVLETLTLEDVVQVFEERIASLGETPLLIGHSMGGLVVQLLLQRGLGRAGVAVNSGPPNGVTSLKWSFLKSNAAMLWPSKKPLVPTLKWFRYAFANTLNEEDSARMFEDCCVPESRLVGRAPTTAVAKIDFRAQRPPLLLTAGEVDRTIPASLSASIHAAYAGSDSVTELHTFPGRDHWLCRGTGWEEVADHCCEWLDAHG